MIKNSEAIPDGLLQSIEQQTNASIVKITPRGGGGASRAGAQIELMDANNQLVNAYLSWDTRVADPQRADFFRREVAVLKALSGQLKGCGVVAPRFLAADKTHLAMATEFVAGSDYFLNATDHDKLGVDFITQLAKLHQVPITDLELDGFSDAHQPPSIHIAKRLTELRAENLTTVPDPLLLLALNWLEDNMPEDRGNSVIVHGDAGVGNFMHHDNKVTAVIDWELCHYGDPMEDLAQIWVRCLFQPFIPMQTVFDAYEAAGGVKVDVDRVRYHRLFFQLSFSVTGHANCAGDFGGKPAVPGLFMLFNAAHMRVICESLGELTTQTLNKPSLPECEATDADWFYQLALDDIKETITPRLADQQASTASKSLARLVKYWRAREQYGSAFAQQEVGELSQALGQTFASQQQARRAFSEAVNNRTIEASTALQLCYNRVCRETELMSGVLGALKDCYFPKLSSALPPTQEKS